MFSPVLRKLLWVVVAVPFIGCCAYGAIIGLYLWEFRSIHVTVPLDPSMKNSPCAQHGRRYMQPGFERMVFSQFHFTNRPPSVRTPTTSPTTATYCGVILDQLRDLLLPLFEI